MTTQNAQSSGPEPEKIKSIFSQVAHKYDVANSVISLGQHMSWKNKLVRLSRAHPGDSVLDCATGTGDLALLFKKAVGSNGKVIGTDFCEDMVAKAPEKAKNQNLKVHFQHADVMNLPFADNHFDICSISYGIRNVQNPLQGLKEMGRVLKPGGVLMVLETGVIQSPLLRGSYNLYTKKILPLLGGWVTGQKSAYEYLRDSSMAFPCGKDFVNLVTSTGVFSNCDSWPLMGGASYIYRAQKNNTPS